MAQFSHHTHHGVETCGWGRGDSTGTCLLLAVDLEAFFYITFPVRFLHKNITTHCGLRQFFTFPSFKLQHKSKHFSSADLEDLLHSLLKCYTRIYKFPALQDVLFLSITCD